MEKCCWLASLEVGCAFSAITFLVFAVADIFLGELISLEEVERAVVVLHSFLLLIEGIMLFVGVLVRDHVCIILFIIFGFGTIIAKVAAVAVFMVYRKRSVSEEMIIILYAIISLGFLIYIMIIAWNLSKKLWIHNHHSIRLSVRHHNWGPHRHVSVMGI